MTNQSTTTKEALEPGACGHVHHFNAVRVPSEFGHAYLRCAYCGLAKHLVDHDTATCGICNSRSAPIAPVVDDGAQCTCLASGNQVAWKYVHHTTDCPVYKAGETAKQWLLDHPQLRGSRIFAGAAAWDRETVATLLVQYAARVAPASTVAPVEQSCPRCRYLDAQSCGESLMLQSGVCACICHTAPASPAALPAEQCPATCADFSMHLCSETHRCVLDAGHPFDPFHGGGVHEFETHPTIVKPRKVDATTPPPTLAKAAAEEIVSRFPEIKEHDKWVTLGRVKIDVETETETFERATAPQLPVKDQIAAIIERCLAGGDGSVKPD